MSVNASHSSAVVMRTQPLGTRAVSSSALGSCTSNGTSMLTDPVVPMVPSDEVDVPEPDEVLLEVPSEDVLPPDVGSSLVEPSADPVPIEVEPGPPLLEAEPVVLLLPSPAPDEVLPLSSQAARLSRAHRRTGAGVRVMVSIGGGAYRIAREWPASR